MRYICYWYLFLGQCKLMTALRHAMGNMMNIILMFTFINLCTFVCRQSWASLEICRPCLDCNLWLQPKFFSQGIYFSFAFHSCFFFVITCSYILLSWFLSFVKSRVCVFLNLSTNSVIHCFSLSLLLTCFTFY